MTTTPQAAAELPADWETTGAFLFHPVGTRDMVFVGPHTIRSLMYGGTRGLSSLPPDLQQRIVPALRSAGWIDEPAPGYFVASDAVLEQALALLDGVAV